MMIIRSFLIMLFLFAVVLYAQEEVEKQNEENIEEVENLEIEEGNGDGNEGEVEEVEDEIEDAEEEIDSSEEDKILEEVILLMEESQYKESLIVLDAILQREPDNGVALFLKGMIYIRTKKTAEGIKLLQKGKELGADLTIYQLELGRGYFLQRKYPLAIAALAKYESEEPGDAEAIKLLGYSYFFVRQFENAQKYLNLALERGDEDTDAINYCLALCALNLKQRKTMMRSIDTVIKDERKSWFRKSASELRDLAEDYKIAEAEKPWWIQFQLGGGYDSNPRAFGDEIPVDVDQRYDWFVSYFLRGEYHTKLTLNSEIYIKGSVFGRKYFELADEIDQMSFEKEIGYRYEFSDYVHGKVGVRNQYYLIDYDPFANDLDTFVGLTFFQNNWIYTEFEYTFEYRWFLDDVNDDEDELGGIYNEFELSQSFYLKPLNSTIKVGYRHLVTNTEGDNFDRNEGSVYLAVNGYILKDNYYGLKLEYRFRDFINDNSIEGEEREDHVYYAQAFFAHKLADSFSLFFSYVYERNDSNLADFDYGRQIFSAGFIASY